MKRFLLTLILIYCWPGICSLNASDAADIAKLVKRLGIAPGGIWVLINDPDHSLSVELSKLGRFIVHTLAPDQKSLDLLRKNIQASNLYGTISADILNVDYLPYAENLINIIVIRNHSSVKGFKALSAVEIFRVLAPLGVVYIGHVEKEEKVLADLRRAGFKTRIIKEKAVTWVKASKPWPKEIDEWTHFLHNADGNPVANDTVVGPPVHFQWVSGPKWMQSHETDSSIKTMVTARGRLFYIENEIPASILVADSPPDRWVLKARDAFNGMLLWKVPIKEFGWPQWKSHWFSMRPGDYPFNIQKRLVAIGDHVYVTLGFKNPVMKLDARTGKILMTYAGTERTCEILYLNGQLILSIRNPDNMKIISVDAGTGKISWATKKKYTGVITDYLKWGTGRKKLEPPKKLAATLNTATDGKTIAFLDKKDIVGISFKDGTQMWRRAFPERFPKKKPGKISNITLWVGTTIVKDGYVIHASPTTMAGLSARTGKILWTLPKQHLGHLWYSWKDVFVINGLVWTWSEKRLTGILEKGKKNKKGKRQRSSWPATINGYDLKTGKLKKEVELGNIFRANHHHRCYRNKATPRYILTSRRGTEFVDLKHGKHTVHNWVRGTCHLGMMPANGLQYAPPHPCKCYIEEKLSGMIVLAPARTQRYIKKSETKLIKGPAYGKIDGPLAGIEDWPAFRQNNKRTSVVDTKLSSKSKMLWNVKLGGKPGAPISVGDKIFIPLKDAHSIVALRRKDGSRIWKFTAGGRIDSPPAYYKGALIFGSRDGRVYCVRAEDGVMAWQFQAAPHERLIGAFEQLESAWPVHGTVLIQKQTAYFVAGRTSQLDGGLFLFGIDALTGKIRYKTGIEGPHYNVDNIEDNFLLPMGTLPDILQSDDNGIYLRNRQFDDQLKAMEGRPKMSVLGGFLDDSYFRRIPWIQSNVGYGRLISNDGERTFCVRMFGETLRALTPDVFFSPGKKGYLLFANGPGKEELWSYYIPIRVRAMVVGKELLCVSGPPDILYPDDPLGAFEGRKGGILQLINKSDGKKIAEHKLPSPPVFNGAIAAQGRLFIATENNSMICFGE